MEPERTAQGRKPPWTDHGVPRAPALIAMVSGVVWLVAVATAGEIPPVETKLGRWMVFRADRFDLRSLLTHHLFHENGVHLFLSMVCVVYAGRALERRWGVWRFSGFYLASALMGALSVSVAALCARHGAAPREEAEACISFGASAAALACLTAYTLQGQDRPVLRYLTERYLIWAGMLLGSSGLIFLQELTRSRIPETRPLFVPHISGIAAGLGLHFAFIFWDRSLRRLQRRRELLQEARTSDMRLRVDELLEKISRDGLESLSRKERTFLENASRYFRNLH